MSRISTYLVFHSLFPQSQNDNGRKTRPCRSDTGRRYKDSVSSSPWLSSKHEKKRRDGAEERCTGKKQTKKLSIRWWVWRRKDPNTNVFTTSAFLSNTLWIVPSKRFIGHLTKPKSLVLGCSSDLSEIPVNSVIGWGLMLLEVFEPHISGISNKLARFAFYAVFLFFR